MSAMRLALSCPARKLSVPMNRTRLESGASESRQMTGMPLAMAAAMGAWNSSGLATDTRIPAGCEETALWKASTSAFGSYEVGPTVSPLTPSPISLVTSRKPASAACQCGGREDQQPHCELGNVFHGMVSFALPAWG